MIKMGNSSTKPGVLHAVINGQDIVSISGKDLLCEHIKGTYRINGNKYQCYLLAEDLIEKGNKILTENMNKNVDILMNIRGRTIINIAVME